MPESIFYTILVLIASHVEIAGWLWFLYEIQMERWGRVALAWALFVALPLAWFLHANLPTPRIHTPPSIASGH